jgi:hypothetical protein
VGALTLAAVVVLSFCARGLSVGVALSGWLVFEVLVRFNLTPTVGIPLAIARELYLLDSDPAERSNQVSARPEEAGRLARDLPPLEIRGDRVRMGNDSFDSDTIDALRALGYAE